MPGLRQPGPGAANASPSAVLAGSRLRRQPPRPFRAGLGIGMEAIGGEAFGAGAERDRDVADLNMAFRRLAEQGIKLPRAQAEQLAQRAGQQGEGFQRLPGRAVLLRRRQAAWQVSRRANVV